MDQIQAAEDAGLGVVVPGDKHWPAGLTDLGAGEPYVLWTRGATSLLGQRIGEQITMTGARAASPYGTQIALESGTDFAAHEITVVSGGAYGSGAHAPRGERDAVGASVS